MNPRSLKKIASSATPGAAVFTAQIAHSTRVRYERGGFIQRTGKQRYALTEQGAKYLGWRPSFFARLWDRITG